MYVAACAYDGGESRLTAFGVVGDVTVNLCVGYRRGLGRCALGPRNFKRNVIVLDLNDAACSGEGLHENLRSTCDAQFMCRQDFGCDGVIGRGCAHVSAKGAVFGDGNVAAGKALDDGACGRGTHGADGDVGLVLDGLCDGRGNFAVEFFGLQFFVFAQTI